MAFSASSVSLPRPMDPNIDIRRIASSSMVDLRPRSPPIDPRRARRQCTDFGISSSSIAPPPPPLPLSPLPPNQLAAPSFTPTSTLSSDSEYLQDLKLDVDLDFPEPPPISPILRKMKSSPLFTLEDAAIRSTGDLLRVRRVVGVGGLDERDWKKPFATATTDEESTLDMDDLGISPLSGENCAVVDHEDGLRRDGGRGHRKFPSTSTMYTTSVSSTMSSSAYPHPPPVPLPPPPVENVNAKSSPRKMRSLRFSPGCDDKPSRRSITRGRSVSMDFHASRRTGLFFPSPLHSQPNPSQGSRQYVLPCPRPQATLETPFSHRPTMRSLSTGVIYRSNKEEGLRSFIDISPEPEKLKGKDKVKRLIKRASMVFSKGGKGLKKSGSLVQLVKR
ncbi:hypothetical protein Moror_12161 [Moniliophthora roreri MCA 2997]|uniref:Uncharacterized protein n=2 Tax=Moniliophthora roreri TaxID=221103 RepID=V2WPE1_MONRO|nr:hypothetical protein Moror_12161 [Moniliophthora roreri MCA 2997]